MGDDKNEGGGSNSSKTKQPQAASMKIEMKPFTGKENFTLWQRRMKSALAQQNLSVVLAGKEKKPAAMTDAEWDSIDELARGAIENYIADEVLFNVMENTAKATWDKLEDMFAGKSLSNKLFAKEELLNLRMDEGGNLMEHLSTFSRCVADLQRMEVAYNTEDKALMLLTSLPPSYKHFRTTLMFGKTTLNFEEVVKDILTHHRINQHAGESSQGEGLFAKSGDRGRSNKREGKKSNKGRSKSRAQEGCFECGSKDHWKRNCPIWKEKKNKGKKLADTAGIVTEGDGELLCINSNVKSNLLAISSRCSSSDWILDSGCSYHMCSNKAWFDTYKEEYGGEVVMGDGSICKIEGTGSIKVKMHDGVVRTLGMVRYIPKLCKNLISLGTLDKNGFNFKAKEGKLIISRGSLVIMKGEIQPNCLYRLNGTTVTGGAAISTNRDAEDETQLWHLRLGHMSERGMQELHKRKLLKGVHSCKLEFCKYCTMGKQSRVTFKQQDKEEESK